MILFLPNLSNAQHLDGYSWTDNGPLNVHLRVHEEGVVKLFFTPKRLPVTIYRPKSAYRCKKKYKEKTKNRNLKNSIFKE